MAMVKSNKTQVGGTLLGLIIGLVIGLAIAVVVALMITKTSTPFTNKLGAGKNGDTPPVQLADPNKPLYGNSVKETLALKSTDSSASNSASSADVTRVPDVKTEVKLDPSKQDPKAAPKTIESIIAQNDAEQKASYYLQVGAFRDSSDAESARAKLALIGVEAHVNQKGAEGDNLFRVRVGPFDQLDTMNRMRSKLTENNIDVAVIKTPK